MFIKKMLSVVDYLKGKNKNGNQVMHCIPYLFAEGEGKPPGVK